MKLTKRVVALILALNLLVGANVYASQIISDVNESHWAYAYVADVLNRQIMGLTTAGNFLPNDLIDKFETCRILARMLGYKSENPTYEEKNYYDNAYQQYKGIMANYSTSFPNKWNSSAEREIAFLLAKEVLNEEDLYQFVIKDQSGSEVLRALSREEAVVFLTRAAGKKNEALTMSYTYDFLDDSSINPSYKQYVYYYKAKQIVVGEDGKFSPKTAVTRATLAVLISKTIQILGSNLPNTQTATPVSTPLAAVVSVTGVIDMLFPEMNAIQIQTESGNKDIYKLSSLATITINNSLSGFSMLQAGMPMSGKLSGGEIIEINAQNTVAAVTPIPQIPTATPMNYETRMVEGIVYEATSTATGMQIKVERNVVSPRGEVTPEILTFAIPTGCLITRGDGAVTFLDIVKGEIIKVTESGGVALSLELEERSITIESGTLLEKRYVESGSTPYLVIQGAGGKVYELRVDNETLIKRGVIGEVTFDKLRLGDVVDAKAEYDRLINVDAFGVTSTIDGIIENINVTKNSSTITIKTSDNVMQTYTVIPGSVDIYSVRINDNVRLRLDSWEIENISILQTAAN